MPFLNSSSTRWFAGLVIVASLLGFSASPAHSQEIPEPLQPWQDWVTWGVKHRDCPPLFSKSDERICFWPSRLNLAVRPEGGEFSTTVRVFEETFVPLPGSPDIWPLHVRVGEQEQPVIERQGQPVIELAVGVHEVKGEFLWSVMPQRVAIPKQIGILSLTVDGKEIESPSWDNTSHVWLKRTRGKPADKDSVSLQIYRLIEDGIPLWMQTEIELTVSGKSREEVLGWVLPEGWQLSTVESPIPVAIDDRGQMKAQVRAGKWTVVLRAFRTTDPNEIAFASDAQVAAATELVGLETNTEFRVSQLDGVPTIDVSQTTYPAKWRNYPVHLWDTTKPFRLVEKMRGMGQQSPPGLNFTRRLWLDEDGKGITYHDKLAGKMQQIWRLDVADGQDLGAVRVDGESQLITSNPTTGVSGVEIRKRDLNMEAIGRLDRGRDLAATGWNTDAESLQMTLVMPPGWRALAVFGADDVSGDWLTAWSLLDLFLLLVFSFAVFRLHGVVAGIVALLAFGLAYHEFGAPRFTWLLLLIPTALLRVMGDGKGKKWVQGWKAVSVAVLLLALVPFVARQSQSVMYPQLESAGFVYGKRGILDAIGGGRQYRAAQHMTTVDSSSAILSEAPAGRPEAQRGLQVDSTWNLKFDPTTRIQTGPAQPQWAWNEVRCFWNGPVTPDQRVTPILISLSQHRILTVVRIALLLLLAAILLGSRRIRLPFTKRGTATVAALLLAIPMASASAQLPNQEMLQELRQRLLETPDVFPNAAEIPAVDLSIDGNQIEMQVQIHAAIDVAVPLPGRLPRWSPVSITVDGDTDVSVTRRDGYLWVFVPKGVHEIIVKGLLPDSTDWDWTFVLKPRTVSVNAPGWNISGVGRNGVPESEVFFVREQESSGDSAAYDRTSFQAIVVVDRYLEIGMISKVRTVVTRLSKPGKAVSLQIALLDGERVLTSKSKVQDGKIAVQLSASQEQTSWESELPVGADVQLHAPDSDQIVERWHLVTSPIWNVSLDGFPPVYESDESELVPVWHPWPGEEVAIALSKPQAVAGDTVTVQRVDYKTTLGSRRRNSSLALELECSIANDFVIQLDPDAEISSLKLNSQSVPVQLDGSKLIVPAQPGKQSVLVEWRETETLSTACSSSEVLLPVESSNIVTTIQVPSNRWVLWTGGPMRGPAVRFWTILVVAILIGLALGSLPLSPLKRYQWVLLTIGLTQVPLTAAAIVVGWLFLMAWRSSPQQPSLGRKTFNFIQVMIVFLTFASLLVLVFVVSQGLLGHPDMFIEGNGSSRTYLTWFQPRADAQLPTASIISVSVWFYRFLMLCWALWLATSLLRWLSWGWKQFTAGGSWRKPPPPVTPIPAPNPAPNPRPER